MSGRTRILAASLHLLLLGFLPHTSGQAAPVRTCYWTDGSTTSSTDDDFRSCNVNGPDGVSHCCALGETCLDNGLCFAGSKGVMYRGGCTDDSWSQNTTACPKYCMAVQRWSDMLPCTPSLGPQIWCGNDSDAQVCKSGHGGETYDYSPGMTMFVVNKTEAATTTTTDSTCVASISGSSTPAGAAAAACKDDASECIAPAVPIGVGVGVGVPLLLACLVLGWMLVRERKGAHRSGTAAERSMMGPEPTGYASETRDDGNDFEAFGKGPLHTSSSLRDELDQARKMQHQNLIELETERGRAEMG